MRDLTPEELAFAPEWATHYIINSEDDNVIYESSKYCWWKGMPFRMVNYTFSKSKSRLIDRKPFNITQHEWSDITMQGYEVAKCANSSIILNGSSKSKVLNKADAIAIARHFKLTGDDIK